MSDFSEKCRQYIEDTGTNIYRLSKISGLDRTSLQRMVTGKRLPGPEFISQFCLYLRINPQQRQELIELYELERIGKPAYYNRKYIQNILENLAAPDFSALSYSPVISAKHQIQLSFAIEEKLQHFLEHSLLRSENAPVLLTNFPPDCISFFRIILHLSEKLGRKFDLKHLFCLCQNPEKSENVNSNLELLQCTLAFALTRYPYQPFFYYSKEAHIDTSALLYPYYLVTESSVLLLTADLKSSILLDKADVVEQYLREAEKQFQSAAPFLFMRREPEEILNFYGEITMAKQTSSRVLESQPCVFSMLYDPDVWASSPENTDFIDPKMLKDTFKNRFPAPYTFHNYFTLSGLERFCQTGRFAGPYACIPVEFSPLVRQKMLEYFLETSLETGEYTMLKPSPLLTDRAYYEAFSDYSIFLCFLDSQNKFLGFYISESYIGQAFFDYFSSLENSSIAYSREETRQIIQKQIQILKEMPD